MNRVVEILMERDGIDEEEARSLIKETRDEILALDDIMEADDILAEYLELEPDYMFDVLNI